MRKEELFTIIGEVDEQKVSVASAAMKTKKKFRPAWIKWGAMAACLCLAIVSAVLLNPNHTDDLPLIISQHEGPKGSYKSPEPGEYYCFVEVDTAREHYAGKNVKFLLAFDLFKSINEKLSDEEITAEYQRLTELGYKLYQTEYWTYEGEGEKVVCPIVVGLFTEEELATFNVNPIYGYAFRFVTNGDSSSISIEESDLVTDFNQCNIK